MALDLVTPFTKVQLEEEIKDTGRKQVGILGGNFNPVHNAHLVVADQVRQQLGLDEVLLMPEFEPPHIDKKETIDEKHRLNMLMLAINGIPGLDIETIELERKGISYTYDTMKLLTEANPDTDYYFILELIWSSTYQNGTVLMNLSRWFNLLVYRVLSIRLEPHILLSGLMCPLWILVQVQSDPTLRRIVHLTSCTAVCTCLHQESGAL